MLTPPKNIFIGPKARENTIHSFIGVFSSPENFFLLLLMERLTVKTDITDVSPGEGATLRIKKRKHYLVLGIFKIGGKSCTPTPLPWIRPCSRQLKYDLS